MASRRGTPLRWSRRAAASLVAAALATSTGSAPVARAQARVGALTGAQEPAWAPNSARIAVSLVDRIWVMAPDGQKARPLLAASDGLEREPAWSPDGRRVAFARQRAEGFDIVVVSADAPSEVPVAVTTLPGDERWPSWTPDGRLVFAHRALRTGDRRPDPGAQWDLYVVLPAESGTGWQAPVRLTDTKDSETWPRVSGDGALLAFISERSSEEDVDLWVMPMPQPGATFLPLGGKAPAKGQSGPKPPTPTRVTNAAGSEAAPSWAPDGARLAFYGVRDGVGAVWVATIALPQTEGADPPMARPKPAAPVQLVSRRAGVPAWSPDGATLLVAGVPEPQPVYNGNPLRALDEPAPLFALDDAYALWRVPAPQPVHESGGRVLGGPAIGSATLLAVFDRTWQTLQQLYYREGPSGEAWSALRERYRPEAAKATSAEALERVMDAMVAEQPLIKPVVTSRGAVVVSGHPLASEAGRRAFEQGGNVVDAMIAVSFALGVVEPEASGLGGDGSAVLFLKGMSRPTVVEYKDQTPGHATPDNPAIVRAGRIVADGPAAANIPGVVAGLDYLYRHYGSGRVAWADLIAPAITLAEDGFVLDSALPTSIAEGRRFLEKWPEAARIFLPGGEVPKPGDRFVNRDYAATLRAIAKDGADTFYRGDIAKKIAADLAAQGGIMTFADLAQYRAVERPPVEGHYRGHALFAGGPPVSTGIQLFESLHVLEQYAAAPSARTTRDADYFHHLLEAWKVRDPLRRVADPDRWPVDFAEHLTEAHARRLFGLIDPRRASRFARVPEDDEPFNPPASRIGRGTTSFAVADAEGNMIAVTQTLSTWGGTFYVSKGLGFLYNNHLRSNRLAEGAYGSLLPLMRSNTSSVPTLVFRQQPGGLEPRLAVGCAGNAWIPLTVYNVITAVIDGGLGAQQAIEAPRFLPGRDPADPLENGAVIEIEDRFPRTVLDDLSRRGHRFRRIGRKGEVRYGYAAAVVVNASQGTVEGGAEPRRSHAAIAASRTP